MAREKGMGNLQQEKSGRWTLRVGINGKRLSRSTGTTDREKAEKVLERFLSPLGLGSKRVPLSRVWREYLISPYRRDLSPATLNGKRLVWNHFANWMEENHLEIGSLAEITREAVSEYLVELRLDHCASTYNNRVCVLREICRTLADRAGIVNDPWEGVRLRVDDSHSRRELTIDEVHRLLESAKGVDRVVAKGSLPNDKSVGEWESLFLLGVYTGLRLGDCCLLEWGNVNLSAGIIQLIPRKTRRHAHGRPVTIPIHPALIGVMTNRKSMVCEDQRSQVFVLPEIAAMYQRSRWQVSHELSRIFKAANITTSVKIEGRRRKTPEATFHSLRHTFVSLAANAGVPLHVVQSIVGHESTAMTRHYYHECVDSLQRAVNAIPTL